MTARLIRTASWARLEDEASRDRGVGAGEADLFVDTPQGDDRGGMGGDLAERARLLLEGLRDGQFDERRRHRGTP